jgi:hypothetical protein
VLTRRVCAQGGGIGGIPDADRAPTAPVNDSVAVRARTRAHVHSCVTANVKLRGV